MRLVALLSLALAGCWPLIPGSWGDYDVPTEAALVGEVFQAQPLGQYWGSTEPTSAAWLVVLETPADLGGWPWQALEEGTCARDFLEASAIPNVPFQNLGGNATLNGAAGDVTLPLDADGVGFYSANLGTGLDAGLYDLVDIGGNAEYSMEGLFQAPGELTLLSPNLDTADVPVMDMSPFELSWQADGAVEVLLSLSPMDADAGRLDPLYCNPGTGGSFTVDPTEVDNGGVGVGMYVSVWAARTEAGRVAWGEQAGNRMSSISMVDGALFYSP